MNYQEKLQELQRARREMRQAYNHACLPLLVLTLQATSLKRANDQMRQSSNALADQLMYARMRHRTVKSYDGLNSMQPVRA